jgi:hypothetical protein
VSDHGLKWRIHNLERCFYRTAQQIGATFARSVLYRADRIINEVMTVKQPMGPSSVIALEQPTHPMLQVDQHDQVNDEF